MKLAVFGLGYVGCVSAAAFARLGHDVVGVDSADTKVSMLNAGTSPVMEPGLPELVRELVDAGRLRATTSGEDAMVDADIALICVGTPSQPNGSLGTDALQRVATTIGAGLARRPAGASRATVVVRSTSTPGTTESVVGDAIASAFGQAPGAGFGLAMNPEFLREGSSLKDFYDPPKTVIGQLDDASGDAVASLYEAIPATVFRVPLRVAEMVKYADNAFHATKISFANELGALCKAMGIDSHEVMKVFCADTKLNISTAYLTPGFAFGGSCLPKDIRALTHAGRALDLELPLLESVLQSNERHLRRAVDMITASGARRVGLFGLSFKPGTDDLRESPLVELAEHLLGKGYDLKIYDPTVSLSTLMGANRDYVERHIPHLSRLLVTEADEVARHGDVCIVGLRSPAVAAALAAHCVGHVVDLVRLADTDTFIEQERYEGIAW